MSMHVIVGKGPIGSTTAAHLLARGDEVRILSRSGSPEVADPALRGAEQVAVEATDAAALTRAAHGADVIYNCVNPAYHRWATDWPPIFEALLSTAESTGAVLVSASNLYLYGPGNAVMTEQTPLASIDIKGQVRAQMWIEAKTRHDAGRIRATEVRASDYLGPRALSSSHAGQRLFGPLLAGKTIRPIGSADQPHSWTYLPDLAAALIAVGETPAAWGSPWHAPTSAPRTFRQVAEGFARDAGTQAPRISPMPMWTVGVLGLTMPMLREIHRIGYQFTEPFVMDSAATQRLLGLEPTDWPTIEQETVRWWRSRTD